MKMSTPYELMTPIGQLGGAGRHLDGDGAVSCPLWTRRSPGGQGCAGVARSVGKFANVTDGDNNIKHSIII